jgi:hypothetical protein
VASGIYDPAFVKAVFDRCSGKYIAFSWICSLGFTERWRRQCVEVLPEPPGPAGYDLMAGTGEAWPHLLRRFPKAGPITAVDISSGMHDRHWRGCIATARIVSHSSKTTCSPARCPMRARISSYRPLA